MTSIFHQAYTQEGENKLSVQVNPDSIYLSADLPARFPKGEESYRTFLEKNLDASTPLKNGAPKGKYKCVVNCFVDVNGKIYMIVPETNYGYGMEKELMRVIKKFPTLFPAEVKGVAVKYKLPVAAVFYMGATRNF